MRSDAKLGLALGILVLGFALAFCCPRPGLVESVSSRESVSLAPRTELTFIPMRAYPPDVPQRAETVERPAQVVASAEEQAPADPPVAPVLPLAGTGEIPAVAEVVATVPLARSPPPDRIAVPPAAPPPTPETYRVQPGDTLSGIAGRLLGSSQRYLEIYEANRDRLSSPDKLPIGEELRLPGASRDVLPELLPSATGPVLVDQADPARGIQSAEGETGGALR